MKRGLFIKFPAMFISVDIVVSNKPFAHIRLREEDKKLLKEIAKKYDISEADVVKIAIKKLAKELGVEVSS